MADVDEEVRGADVDDKVRGRAARLVTEPPTIEPKFRMKLLIA